jgi:hypothetical protein
MRTTPRWALPVIFLAFAVAILRIGMLVGYTPLLALANSYDQARYSGCFDLYPDRPDFIRPDTNSPEAPFSFYSFRKNPVPLCYLSTDLVLQSAVVAGFRIDQAVTGAERFDVRWLGWLRLSCLSILCALLCRAWWKRGIWGAALGNALAFALVLADPANTIYFSTFYAEAAALFMLFVLLNLVALWQDDAPNAKKMAGLAVIAMALSVSKIQHLALPLALAAVMLVHGYFARRRWHWQGLALLTGAVLGCLVQFVQLGRADPLMVSIRSYNRADVVFTALLPHVQDPAATLQRLGLPERCVAYIGKPAWQLPGIAEEVCPGIGDVGRGAIVVELLRQPATAMRLAGSGFGALHPWLAPNLGIVEGEILGRLPPEFFTLSRPLEALPLLRYVLFALPLLLAPFAFRRRDRIATFTLLVAALGPATLGVILLGDGLADVPKQGHLIFNADLLWCVIALPALLMSRRSAVSGKSRRADYVLDGSNGA